MITLRCLLAHRSLAILVCLAALAMKLLVPSGYMIAADHGHFTITLCPGMSGPAMRTGTAMHSDMAIHADMADHAMPQDHGSSKDHGKTEMPCAFSSLSAQALGAVDPILLVATIVFVMAIAQRPGRPLPRPSTRYLRPPLRGPPALIR